MAYSFSTISIIGALTTLTVFSDAISFFRRNTSAFTDVVLDASSIERSFVNCVVAESNTVCRYKAAKTPILNL